jgi:catechol 2,3-dioxygenase-like lactoylglutathione lyase family enzyme
MKYAHTNIVAQDWRSLTDFYIQVFGCTPVPPERDLSGEWLERATGIEGARIRGIHLRLPGHGENGPTLELFQYDADHEHPMPLASRPGLGHIAFAVEDVAAVKVAVLEAGGGAVGEVVSVEIPGAGDIEFAYLKDPEGNIIEIQRVTRL